MAKADFITIQNLKEISLISQNVDESLLTPMLRMVQDIHLQPIIGTPMYDDFKTKITALSLSQPEKDLIKDYMYDVIVYYMLMESQKALRIRYMNKGMMVKSSDNSQPVDSLELKVYKDDWRNIAEAYGQALTKYLQKNKANWPLYDIQTDVGDQSIKNNYTTGIYFPEC